MATQRKPIETRRQRLERQELEKQNAKLLRLLALDQMRRRPA